MRQCCFFFCLIDCFVLLLLLFLFVCFKRTVKLDSIGTETGLGTTFEGWTGEQNRCFLSLGSFIQLRLRSILSQKCYKRYKTFKMKP